MVSSLLMYLSTAFWLLADASGTVRFKQFSRNLWYPAVWYAVLKAVAVSINSWPARLSRS